MEGESPPLASAPAAAALTRTTASCPVTCEPPQPTAAEVVSASAAAAPHAAVNPLPDEAWQLEHDALRDLLELDGIGARVTWPPNMDPVTARYRIQILAELLEDL